MKDKTCLQTTDKPEKPQATEETGSTCNECGEKFDKPLLTSISNQGTVQTYYACPRCLSKIPEDNEKEKEETEALAPSEGPEKGARAKPQNEKCPHFLGYLKKRPKETPIPEACLTCERIIECMATN